MPEPTGSETRVVARNPSSGSENRIHADDVARRHGFRGGLVPGVTVYGYLAGFLTDTLGPGWVGGGRFVTLDVSWVGPDPADVIATATHTAIWHLSGT